jgi:UDP-3-O-[3-hydroxymyristoyl] glucosamine N-acyltransferase
MKLSQIAQALNCSLPDGAADKEISRIASLESADDASITFVVNPRFAEAAAASQAGALLVSRGVQIPGKLCLEVPDPYMGYARVGQLFEDRAPSFGTGIHPAAVIDPTASVQPGAHVGPGSVIGRNCTVGKGTIIAANCVVEADVQIGEECRIDSGVIIRYESQIGNRVIIQSGTVIGSDGFANAREKDGRFVRIPCFGRVEIEDDVEIGANCTIDRGNFEPTVIRQGARLDNLVHIAHNVTVGEHTAMAAQTGISGSTRVGKRVLIGGQVGFVGHIEIGDDAFIGAKAGVSKDVEPGSKITGYPARDLMGMRRIEAAQQSLPGMLKQLKALAKTVEELSGRVK